MWRKFAALVLALGVGLADLTARGGGGCVAAGTLIDTPDGPQLVETLKVGDAVWSLQAGNRIRASVQAVYAVNPAEYIELTAEGGTLQLTAEHPVQTAPGVFTRAEMLTAQSVLCSATASLRLTGIRRVPADKPAYNLLVSPGGVFFANGLLVHNKGCFLPDTPITMADGSRRAIGGVKTGDLVLAFSPDGLPVPTAVRRVLTHQVDSYLVVRTATTELHVTEEHPFYVGGGVFRTIESLHIGDAVQSYDGTGRFTTQRILAMERRSEAVTVYNLEVDSPHTFVASGLAVHNKGGGCFAPGTLVATPGGPRSIETLRLGDQILAPRPDGSVGTAAISGIYLNFTPQLLIHTASGDLRTTDEHPLLTATKGFLPAGMLQVGTRLARADNGIAEILAMTRTSAPGPVYTLQVDAPHTFIADGFVVHNKGGGGGGFRSSGGSHRSSGGGGGDANPIVMIIVVGVFIFVFINILKGQRGASADEDLDYSFTRDAIEPKAAKTRKLLEFVARTDASVDPGRLEQTVSTTFRKLQECWSARAYEPMQPLLMPDLYAEHCAQLRGLRQTHEINRLENLRIEQVDLVHLHYAEKESERSFTALLTVWLRDYYVDDRTGNILRGDTEAARFQEFWVFQRWEGTWRLREIEQTRESDCLKLENFFAPFTETGRDQVYGETAGKAGPAGPDLPPIIQAKDANIDRLLNFLVVTDRIWDREAMLATARRTYLNVLLAWQDGRPEAFAGLTATPEMAAHLRRVNEDNQQRHWRPEYRNLCVRKVELVHINNRHDRHLDSFTARISAHAQVIITQDGAIRHQDEFVKPWIEFWTFVRADQLWVLQEILPGEKGAALIALENTDEGSSSEMLQWYYSKERAT